MKITIELYCPHCQSTKIKKNGKKSYKKQNYLCKDCGRQFIGDHALTCKGCYSKLYKRIEKMLVRGVGIRDIAEIEEISTDKVLSVLSKSEHVITPKQSYYPCLEVDEFWTYVANKSNKIWLIYAYDRESGEIVCFVWGKRDLQTAMKLKKKLLDLQVYSLRLLKIVKND
jgi:transposase-like protein